MIPYSNAAMLALCLELSDAMGVPYFDEDEAWWSMAIAVQRMRPLKDAHLESILARFGL